MRFSDYLLNKRTSSNNGIGARVRRLALKSCSQLWARNGSWLCLATWREVARHGRKEQSNGSAPGVCERVIEKTAIMELRGRIAQVHFKEPSIHLAGRLEAAERNCVQIAFDQRLPAEVQSEGVAASLAIPVESVIYLAPATIAEASSNSLALNITGAIRAIQRRAAPRAPYREAVSIRILRASGLAGAWFWGEALDIGLGGIQIRCAHPMRQGTLVEVRAPLPAAPSASIKRQPAAAAPQQFWLRAKGRVVHARQEGNEYFVAGIQFMHLTAEEELRVLDLVEATMGADRRKAA